MMKQLGVAAVFAIVMAVSLAAGNAHFVGVPSFKVDADNALDGTGKVAGLGNIPQINVTLSADAACVNRGGNHPKAENKESFSAEGSFPVQNGRAVFAIELQAVFQPNCTPPMTVVWSNISLVVTAEDGTFLTFP